MRITSVARERRHTVYFLDTVSAFAPVFLDTEVDMTAVGRARAAGPRLSVTTCVLHVAGHVLHAHPEANAAIRGRLLPRIARYESVNGKLTLDKTLGGRRVVVAFVLPDLQTASLAEIQERVDHYRDGDPAVMPEFAKLRLLHRLPMLVGRTAFRATLRPLRSRADVLGTFAVTSLGHRPVDGFHSVGGTTITLGLGQVRDRPVVRDGVVTVAPVMRLSLAFDHRVIDGAEAADVLAEIKDGLERFAPRPAGTALSRIAGDA